jgi:multiple sugar transport system ATP-binding protein
MTPLSLKKIGKSYDGRNYVIRDLNLEIRAGEFMVFVGPSGCGKTTLLRMIAGLEEISEGEVSFGDSVVNELDPGERGAAMVFQSYALYPHMTVAENLGFGLKMSGVAKPERERAVNDVAKVLQIDHMLSSKPKALSGGQRQRVAIGRAIVRNPKVFLFDEPLSNLDAALRVQMRIELARLHKQLGTTMIYVTHDQVEAMTLGQRIAVFNAGRIEQVGTPLELYDRPENRFVAQFIGSPKMNVLAAEYDGVGRLRILRAGSIAVPSAQSTPSAIAAVGIRPEDVQLHDLHEADTLAATVTMIEHLGDATVIYLELAGADQPVTAKLHGSNKQYAPGDQVGLTCVEGKLRCFDGEGVALRPRDR